MSLIANNNRKPAWKLVLKSLKTNRFRTFCILFAICTCTFVMTFLPCVNTLDYLNAYEDFSGEEHAVYTSLTGEEITALSQDTHFEKVLLEKYGDLGQLEVNMPGLCIRNLLGKPCRNKKFSRGGLRKITMKFFWTLLLLKNSRYLLEILCPFPKKRKKASFFRYAAL